MGIKPVVSDVGVLCWMLPSGFRCRRIMLEVTKWLQMSTYNVGHYQMASNVDVQCWMLPSGFRCRCTMLDATKWLQMSTYWVDDGMTVAFSLDHSRLTI